MRRLAINVLPILSQSATRHICIRNFLGSLHIHRARYKSITALKLTYLHKVWDFLTTYYVSKMFHTAWAFIKEVNKCRRKQAWYARL